MHALVVGQFVAWACALAAGTASQRLNNDAATTRTRCNVVLVVISHPRGVKGDCHSAPTVGSPAVVRGLAPSSRRHQPLAITHVTGTATKTSMATAVAAA